MMYFGGGRNLGPVYTSPFTPVSVMHLQGVRSTSDIMNAYITSAIGFISTPAVKNLCLQQISSHNFSLNTSLSFPDLLLLYLALGCAGLSFLLCCSTPHSVGTLSFEAFSWDVLAWEAWGHNGAHSTNDMWSHASQTSSARGLREQITVCLGGRLHCGLLVIRSSKMHFKTKCEQDLSKRMDKSTKRWHSSEFCQMSASNAEQLSISESLRVCVIITYV